MRNTTGMISVAMAVLLAACKGDAPPPAQQAPAEAPAPAQTQAGEAEKELEALIKDMVTAVYTEGGEPAVMVKFDLKSRPERGTPLDIDLVFIPRQPAASLGATFVADGGLSVPSEQPPAEFSEVEAGTAYTHELRVMPEEDGVHYVSVVTELALQPKPLMQTFYIPVIVGAPSD